MQRALKGQEQLAYVAAADLFATDPSNKRSITEMMRLALEGLCPAIQKRASDWLFRNVGVKVVDDGESHAASTEATGIRR